MSGPLHSPVFAPLRRGSRVVHDPLRLVRAGLGSFALEKTQERKEIPTGASIARHRQAIEDFNKARAKADEQENLKARQAQRRRTVEQEAATLKAAQARERQALLRQQKRGRSDLRAAYLDEMKRRRIERARNAPKGLAAFLGRITGIALVTKKLHQYRDRKRSETFLADRRRLKDRQGQERLVLRRSQRLEAADATRKLRWLDQVEQRERRSLETAQLKGRRIDERRRHDHRMPPVRAWSRDAAKPRRVTNPHSSMLARELAERANARKRVVTDVNLKGDFKHVAGRGDAETSGDSDKAPAVRRTIHDHRAAKRRVVTEVNLQGDFEHAATDQNSHAGEDASSSDGPQGTVISSPKTRRPRRQRTRKPDKDFDRDR